MRIPATLIALRMRTVFPLKLKIAVSLLVGTQLHV
jgi:hypothetical protein